MTNREETIMRMCYSQRHDYGLEKSQTDQLSSGMSAEEREILWKNMAQLFDHCVAPYMMFKVTDSRYLCGND
jgi:hypothetical protein